VTARLLVAALAGAALSAAYEPIAVPYLLPLAVAAFALTTGGLSVPRAGLVGWVFGLCFYLIHIDWLAPSEGVGAWLPLAVLVSLSYAVVGLTVPLVRALPLWPLWLAVVWTAVEDLRSTWPFGGMPWGRLAFAAIDTPVAAAVAYVGMSLLSLLLALIGFQLARAIEERSVRWTLATVAVVALAAVPAVAPYPFHRTGSTTVAAVQGNVPGRGDNMIADPRGITRNESQATVRLADQVRTGRRSRPSFVLWPENSTVVDVFMDPEANAYVNQAVDAVDVPVLVGGVVDLGRRYMLNQGIVWDPQTGPGDRYTKHHPVPWGEYVPLRHIWDARFGKLALVPRDMLAGTRTTPLRVGSLRVGDAICFDVAYDDVLREQVRNGAQLLAVQTSNASFIYTPQVDQQFAITRLRAIEDGRWLVVASTNGLSGVIAPDGTVVQTAPRRTQAILEQTVGLGSGITPAVWLGAWPSRVVGGLGVLALLCGVVTYRRRRGEATSQARAGALRRLHRDAADRALRDRQGRELDRDPADDRPARPGQPDRDVVDQA